MWINYCRIILTLFRPTLFLNTSSGGAVYLFFLPLKFNCSCCFNGLKWSLEKRPMESRFESLPFFNWSKRLALEQSVRYCY